MEQATKSDWIEGPADLKEAVVEDVPSPGKQVRVRGLAAAYSNEAQKVAAKIVTSSNGEQVVTADPGKMEVLQFAYGCVDPPFTVEEAQKVAEKYGPAFKKVIAKIDELSGVDKEAIESAQATFPVAERSGNGSSEAVAVPAPAGDS